VVREVVHFAELARPPGMPALLEGFLNYAGEILPVVRLDRLFHLGRRPPGVYSPMLVLRPAFGRLVVLVDSVRTVTTVPRASLLPVEDVSVLNGCVQAEVRLGDEVVHVLAPDRILLEQERRRMDELRDMVEQRLVDLGCPA
jgi:purine-binding chemotaxis protein CheW